MRPLDFWTLVDKAGSVPEFAPHLGRCWTWTGYTDHGYGRHGKRGLAHRIAYEAMIGPIPEGLDIDHLCRNTVCVDPSHMEPVTRAENVRRARSLQTRCLRGHALSGDNVRLELVDGYWRRRCRVCDRERVRPVVACPECGRTVTAHNIAAHRRTKIHAAAITR